jgi:hypothetical protein
MGLLIGGIIAIVFFVSLSVFLGLDFKQFGIGCLVGLGILLVVVIILFSMIHYGGRSMQIINPP